MWKNEISTQSNLIKGSDQKKLKKSLLDCFPDLKPEDLDVLLPNKCELSKHKVSDSRVLIYVLNKDPLFFDISGKGDIYPTVYGLWKLPPFMNSIFINPNTFKFIAKGADLMLPGVIGDVSQTKKGEKMVVRILHTGAPVAVGKVIMNQGDIVLGTGKFLEVKHFYTDQLWRFGSKEKPPEEISRGDVSPEESAQEEDQAEIDTNENIEEVLFDAESQTIYPKDHPKMSHSADLEEGNDITSSQPIEGDETSNVSIEEHAPEIHTTLTIDEMDVLMLDTLLQSLHRKLKDADLPVFAANFWSQFYLPCRVIGASINVKKSSYQKFGAFLKHFALLGLIAIDESVPGVIKIIEVNRNHPLYVDYRPLSASKTHENDNKDEETESKETLSVNEYWRLSKPVLFIVEDAEVPDKLLLSDANKLLWDYVSRHELTKGIDDKHKVSLDSNFSRIVFGNATKVGEIIDKKLLAQKFKDNLRRMHEIEVNGEVIQSKGPIKPILISCFRRTKKKYYTSIEGVWRFGLSPKEVGKALSNTFATSAGYIKTPNENIDSHLYIQVLGDIRKGIKQFFKEKFNVDEKYLKISENVH